MIFKRGWERYTMDIDIEGVLKLSFLYLIVALGGGFVTGKVMGGINHWRSPAMRQQILLLFVIAGAVWGVCHLNEFGMLAMLVGWTLTLVGFASGCLWIAALRLREQVVLEEAAVPFPTPASQLSLERTERQLRRWCDQRDHIRA